MAEGMSTDREAHKEQQEDPLVDKPSQAEGDVGDTETRPEETGNDPE